MCLKLSDDGHEHLLAVHHYNRARHLRAAYWQADYFLREFAGVLFLAGRYIFAQRFYREAVRLQPDDPDLTFLFGDALLFSGMIGEARACFLTTVEHCTAPQMLREAELKILFCDHLIAVTGLETVPTRREAANLKIQPDGLDHTEHLEKLIRETDTLHPLANFNLGIIRSREGNRLLALHHFLACAFVQPSDVEAWSNAAICTVGLQDGTLFILVLSVAIKHMGSEAYNRFRTEVETQGIHAESLALIDKLAMEFLEESERLENDGFTVRMLDGDTYQAMTMFEPD